MTSLHQDAPLPEFAVIKATLRDLESNDPRCHNGATANIIARALGIVPARRLGNGAVRGSWSGSMAPGLRLSPRLSAMARRGLLTELWDHENYRYLYSAKGH